MSLKEPAQHGSDDDAGPVSRADERMAKLLSERTQVVRARRNLQDEGSDEADDLLGRLNALDFIDSVIGDDYELPSRIGDFEITGVLGRGGMGTVYQAFQKSLDREIALKVLSPKFSSDLTMRQRFRKEAKATAAMHHQHIVPIYGYGEAGGHLFFAMERVHGVSLDKHITVARRRGEGALDPLDAARRFAGVADALSLAHKRQILHRDVKPGNILVHGDGTLALADFGLSKFLGEASVHLTSVGGFLGTLHYSSPEQARGDKVGPPADLYSLGVTIFEAVTGELPVSADSTEGMLNALLHDNPARLRQKLPRVSRDLDAVLHKLLQKDPRDRYQDGESLALDLLRVAEGEPVRIRRLGLATRVYRRARKNPLLTAAVLAAVVLVVVTVLLVRSASENVRIKRENEGRQHLFNAAVEVTQERGAALGPFGLLNVLTGAQGAEQLEDSRVLAELEAAMQKLPSERPSAERYRRAYLGGALQSSAFSGDSPAVLLEVGNGVVATNALEAQMREFDLRPTEDLGTQIDAYNLYLARAIASLSASIGDPQKALNDVNIAQFIRKRAFLPHLLRDVLTWQDRDNPQQLIRRLDTTVFARSPDPDERRATAELLLAFSGVCPAPTAHIMRFDMSFASRRVLARKALEWLDLDSAPGKDGDYHGLSRRLADHAKSALLNLGDKPAMSGPLRAARQLLATHVADGSELRSWWSTFALLGDQESKRVKLTLDQRLTGAIHYVRLVQGTLVIPAAELQLRQVTDTVDELLAAAKAESGVPRIARAAVELRARMDAWLVEPQSALASVEAWLKIDDQHPEAEQAHFCCLVRRVPQDQGQRIAALIVAVRAKDYVMHREDMRDRLRRRVDAQLAALRAAGQPAPQLETLARELSPQEGK